MITSEPERDEKTDVRLGQTLNLVNFVRDFLETWASGNSQQMDESIRVNGNLIVQQLSRALEALCTSNPQYEKHARWLCFGPPRYRITVPDSKETRGALLALNEALLANTLDSELRSWLRGESRCRIDEIVSRHRETNPKESDRATRVRDPHSGKVIAVAANDGRGVYSMAHISSLRVDRATKHSK